jgi:hypothetical protein
MFGGFINSLSSATNVTRAYDTTSQTWRQLDDIPFPSGITHIPKVFVDNKIIACGGFIGGNSANLDARNECFMYTHGNAAGTQWVSIPSLPDIRAGGAMFHDSRSIGQPYGKCH